MALLNTIDLQIGIYDTQATIIRHRNGDVTIAAPWIKWTQDNGSLAFKKIHLSGAEANRASAVFSDNPPIVKGDPEYPLGYSEFINNYI